MGAHRLQSPDISDGLCCRCFSGARAGSFREFHSATEQDRSSRNKNLSCIRAMVRVMSAPVADPRNAFLRVEQHFDHVDTEQHRRPPHAIAAKRSEEQTSELQPLMRNTSAVFCLKKTKKHQ